MYRYFIKPLLDFIIASIMLLCFLPLFLLLAIIIKLSSKGPIFFQQERGGFNGSYFKILKFRSMTVKEKSDGKEFDAGSDLRVTGIGKILRKSKLDELPQLINVIKGDMSLVGPRPEVRTYIELYSSRWDKIHSVRPGITDPASVTFRNEEELLAEATDPEKEYREVILPKKLSIYEEYLKHISPMHDLKVLITTVLAVCKG